MKKIAKINGTTTQSLQNNNKIDTDRPQNNGSNKNKTQYNNSVQTLKEQENVTVKQGNSKGTIACW